MNARCDEPIHVIGHSYRSRGFFSPATVIQWLDHARY
jgi:hypothetical protein